MNVVRLDDIYQRETQNRLVLHNLDWRLQRLENVNMNMCRMMQKILDNQTSMRSSHVVRSSSLSPNELDRWKSPNLVRQNHLEIYSSQKSSTKKPGQLARRSTIHRLSSSTNKESNNLRFQPNEYISITDAIDTTNYEYRCSTPILPEPTNQRTTLNDSTMVLFEPRREDPTSFDDDDSTQPDLNEILLKQGHRISSHQLTTLTTSPNPSENYCDSDRVSLSSVEINSNLIDRE